MLFKEILLFSLDLCHSLCNRRGTLQFPLSNLLNVNLAMKVSYANCK